MQGIQIIRKIKRSILELCIADHQNDPAILARRLGNKTPESIASWIALLVYLSGGYMRKAAAMLRFPGDCPGHKMSKPLTTAF